MGQTQRIGGKNGSKRHLLVDGRGVPLSIIVTGANRHDVSQLEAVLDGIVVQRPQSPARRNKHLCADAGYTGAPALGIIEKRGYIPHVTKGADRKPKTNGAIRRNAPEDGLWRSRIVGSIAFASC